MNTPAGIRPFCSFAGIGQLERMLADQNRKMIVEEIY